ncbi:MAG: tetratricopeptide repeat protein [Lachnospiraceae bacterium]|jgi:tetratricopeptide (TPR) repeat protein|nr:tetratricopeptide repeat protein [Lachnospiraceae bacterium]
MGKKRRSQKAYALAKAALAFSAAAAVSMAGCQDKEALEKQETYRQLGIKELNEGKYEDAVKDFQKALEQSKAKVGDLEIDICYYKATAQYSSGDTEGALSTCTALIDYDKKDAKAYFLRGSIYLKQGEGKQGLEDYNTAFQYCKDDFGMYIAAYGNLTAAGFEHEAQGILEEAVKIDGEEPEQCRERGYLYFLQGYYENARRELDKAINQGDAKALLYLAQVYDAQGDSKQAKPLYESYIEKNSADVSALNQLGEMQLEAGKYEQALVFFQNALAAGAEGHQQQLRKNEIIAYEKMLDFAAAKEKMETYIQDYPDDEGAQREYVFLQTR